MKAIVFVEADQPSTAAWVGKTRRWSHKRGVRMLEGGWKIVMWQKMQWEEKEKGKETNWTSRRQGMKVNASEGQDGQKNPAMVSWEWKTIIGKLIET